MHDMAEYASLFRPTSCVKNCPTDTHVRFRSIRLSQSLVAKVAVAGALHDGLRARELDVRTKSLGQREVRTADQQESELRLTQLLVELGVSASRNIELEGVL